jgi:hypothetical protein
LAPITYNEFKARVTQGVERYLQSLAGLIQQGQLRAAPGYVFLFPSTLIFTETKTHYVFELLGSRREHGSLLIRENSRITSFNRLVGGFEADPSTIYLFGTGTSEQTYCHITYSHMTLTSASDMERLEQRFPGFASLSPKSQLRTLLPTAAFMPIDAQSIRTLALSRCYLTSHVGEIIRPRYVNFLFGESIESAFICKM